MDKSSRFISLVALQLCIPAVVYFLVGLYSGGTIGIADLFANYLFMAAPHLLLSLLAIRPNARRPTLIWGLSFLNALLVAFQLWVLHAVPSRESGLAWIFYLPLWSLALAALAIAWVVVKYSGPTRKSSAGESRGT